MIMLENISDDTKYILPTVKSCGVVCVVCFLRLWVVCCDVVNVWVVLIFVLSVMRVVGGIPLLVV